MICKKCGAVNPEGVKFCTECGAKSEEDVLSYKCPCCGSGLRFSGGEQQLKCDSCGNTFPMETLAALNDSAADKEEKTDWGDFSREPLDLSQNDNMKTYICKSCGAEIIVDENTGATSCPYCDSPIVLSDRVGGGLTPDAIIPFKVERDDLKDIFKEFCGKRAFIPKNFFSDQRIKEIKGIYVPFWLFDCTADADLNYDAEIVHHRSDAKYEYTITEHYLLRRAGEAKFEKIPVDGSEKMDDTYMESIEPFDYKALADFNTAYLTGYLADKFDVDAQTSIERANKRVRESVLQEFKTDMTRYSGIHYKSGIVNIEKGNVKYVFLPVWLLNAKYGDKMYTYVINGQTGKMIGEVPVSWGSFFKTVFIFTLIAAVIIFLILTIMH